MSINKSATNPVFVQHAFDMSVDILQVVMLSITNNMNSPKERNS